MTAVVHSFRYPIERLDDGQLAALTAIDLPDGARIVWHVEVEAPSLPGAVNTCWDTSRLIEEAALPPLAWRNGADACPGCGRPVEAAGDDDPGVLF